MEIGAGAGAGAGTGTGAWALGCRFLDPGQGSSTRAWAPVVLDGEWEVVWDDVDVEAVVPLVPLVPVHADSPSFIVSLFSWSFPLMIRFIFIFVSFFFSIGVPLVAVLVLFLFLFPFPAPLPLFQFMVPPFGFWLVVRPWVRRWCVLDEPAPVARGRRDDGERTRRR